MCEDKIQEILFELKPCIHSDSKIFYATKVDKNDETPKIRMFANLAFGGFTEKEIKRREEIQNGKISLSKVNASVLGFYLNLNNFGDKYIYPTIFLQNLKYSQRPMPDNIVNSVYISNIGDEKYFSTDFPVEMTRKMFTAIWEIFKISTKNDFIYRNFYNKIDWNSQY